VGPRASLDHSGEEISYPARGIEPQFVGYPARSLVTKLSRFSMKKNRLHNEAKRRSRTEHIKTIYILCAVPSKQRGRAVTEMLPRTLNCCREAGIFQFSL
jgi:hypothetical protein